MKRRKFTRGEEREFFDRMYERGDRQREAMAEAFALTPEGEAARKRFNEETLSRMRAERLKKNPHKRRTIKRRKHVTAKRRVVKRETLRRNPVKPLASHVKHLWTIEAAFPHKSSLWFHFTNDNTFADTGGNRMLFHSAASATQRMYAIKKNHAAKLAVWGCSRLRVSRYQ
jgi:hypothetical protein